MNYRRDNFQLAPTLALMNVIGVTWKGYSHEEKFSGEKGRFRITWPRCHRLGRGHDVLLPPRESRWPFDCKEKPSLHDGELGEFQASGWWNYCIISGREWQRIGSFVVHGGWNGLYRPPKLSRNAALPLRSLRSCERWTFVRKSLASGRTRLCLYP